MQVFQKYRHDLIALLAIITAVFIFFWPIISGQVWIPRGGGDLVSFIYPMYRFAAHSLQSGEIPLWNPTLYAGAPFVSDNQSGLFYPINLILFLFNPQFSYNAIQWLVILHFMIAGVGMYVCLRLWRVEDAILPLPALLGAIAFTFSDLFITHIGNLNLNAVISWLPLAVLCLHRGMDSFRIISDEGERREKREKRSILGFVPLAAVRWMIAGGLIVGVSTLAGHGQMTFMLGLFLALYGVVKAIVDWNGRYLFILAGMGLIGIGSAAINLIPAALQIQHTPRAGFDFAQSTNHSLPIRGLVNTLAPDFYGRGILRFWGGWPRAEAGYMGVLPWIFGVALFSTPKWREGILWAGGVIFFLLLALGGNSPIYELLFSRLPIVPFQVPARFVVLMAFCLAMLAALGLDGLIKSNQEILSQKRWHLGATAVILLIIIAIMGRGVGRLSQLSPDKMDQMQTAVLVFIAFALLSWGLWSLFALTKLNRMILAGTAVFLLAVDIISLGRNVEIEPNNPTLGYPLDSPALEFIQSDDTFYRIDVATGEWQPSTTQLTNQYAIGGVFNPLSLSNYTAYIGSMGFRGSSAYNLLGVKYIVGNKDNPPGDTNFLISVFEEDPRVTVYLNTLALPRIMVIQNTQMVATRDEAFIAIHEDSFDPSQTIVLEDGRPLSQEPGAINELLLLQYDLNEVRVKVNNEKPAYLLLTDMFHPDWQATINEEPTEILQANYALRAVFLEAGEHVVHFRFIPAGWRASVAITAVVWLSAIATLFALQRSTKPLPQIKSRSQKSI